MEKCWRTITPNKNVTTEKLMTIINTFSPVKTSLQQEMIIQVGDKDDFSSKQDFEKANEILEEWLLGFENEIQI